MATNSIILVIDDDSTIVHLLKENLEQLGYRILEGYDGQAALQLAKTAKPTSSSWMSICRLLTA